MLGLGLMAPLWPLMAAAPVPVRPRLQFPRDLGSHPDFSIEWWYLTGRLLAGTDSGSRSNEREFGFQLTFFRSRVAATQGMSSNFAAKQLIFAHAAITDVAGKKLLHDQRIARAGFGLAQASEQDTAVTLRDWSLVREATQYKAKASGSGFGFDLALQETQPLLLQGEQGLSRKGPDENQASYYYSLPQLKVSGTLTIEGRPTPVQGSAWFDHEWSQALMHPKAVGWDWIGMNLLDGGALTAFRLRDQVGHALWGGGSYRQPSMDALPQVFSQQEVQFEALRYWTSPLTQARYPVEWLVRIQAQRAAGTWSGLYRVKAVIDNQELDSRNSTGAVYWEGLSELFDQNDRLVGRGYLELTGYAGALRL
jgi:predicted secreted hydrolase